MKLSALARGFFSLRRTGRPVSGSWRQSALRAFTLIEILVSLVITLIMMGAVVTLFGVVTDSVSGSRALLETADRLRAARNRISLDLQGATVTPIPPRRPENDEGYLEIVEGADTDSDNNNMWPDDKAPYLPLPPGPQRDFVSFSSLFGDCDDALLLTTRSRGEPFIGKLSDTPVESQVAEVAYFLRQDGPTVGFYRSPSNTQKDNEPVRLYTLYRRCMLVRPSGGVISNATTDALYTSNAFYYLNDISARVEGGTRVANSLGDLTKPENRFGRLSTVFPSKFNATLIDRWKTKADGWGTPSKPGPVAAGQDGFDSFVLPSNITLLNGNPLNAGTKITRTGDDVVLTNVLAFDVQVFEPGAPVFIETTTTPPVALEPRDKGYLDKVNTWAGSYPPTGPNSPASFGAYADLGIAPAYNPPIGPPNNYPRAPFFGRPVGKSFGGQTVNAARPFTYDTWSLHYEADGVVQAGAAADQGQNGLDDDNNGIVDSVGESDTANGVDDDGDGMTDNGEADTLPPYSAPLRGLRITIRVYEPGSQQIRQVTVVQDFLQQ